MLLRVRFWNEFHHKGGIARCSGSRPLLHNVPSKQLCSAGHHIHI